MRKGEGGGERVRGEEGWGRGGERIGRDGKEEGAGGGNNGGWGEAGRESVEARQGGDSAGSPAIPRAQKAGECGSEFPTLSRQGRSESLTFAGLWVGVPGLTKAGVPGLAKAGVPATRCESPT